MAHQMPHCKECIDCRKIEAAVRMWEERPDDALALSKSADEPIASKMMRHANDPFMLAYFLKLDLEDWGLSATLIRNSVQSGIVDVVLRYDPENKIGPITMQVNGEEHVIGASELRKCMIRLFDLPKGSSENKIIVTLLPQ